MSYEVLVGKMQSDRITFFPTDFEKRRRNPSFLKKLWPQNMEVLFFPAVDRLGGLQMITSNEQGIVRHVARRPVFGVSD